MPFDPSIPYNDLPPLPPPLESIETAAILRKCISARVALAELRQAAELIPNAAVLVNALPLLEAQASSEIENIVTTTDKLLEHVDAPENRAPYAASAVRSHRDQIGLQAPRGLDNQLARVLPVRDLDRGLAEEQGVVAHFGLHRQILHVGTADLPRLVVHRGGLGHRRTGPGGDNAPPLHLTSLERGGREIEPHVGALFAVFGRDQHTIADDDQSLRRLVRVRCRLFDRVAQGRASAVPFERRREVGGDVTRVTSFDIAALQHEQQRAAATHDDP